VCLLEEAHGWHAQMSGGGKLGLRYAPLLAVFSQLVTEAGKQRKFYHFGDIAAGKGKVLLLHGTENAGRWKGLPVMAAADADSGK
jgi:hypothetical protein